MAERLRTVELPSNQLTVPAVGEQLFGIRHSDWKRLRTRVKGLGRPMAGLASAAWAVVGIGVSAILGWIAWLGTEAQMSAELRLQFTAISPVLFTTGLASAVVATAFFVVDRKLVAHTSVTVDQVVDEMDELYAPYSSVSSSDAEVEDQQQVLLNDSVEGELISTNHPPVTPATPNESAREDGFHTGARVAHDGFGEGTVLALNGQGAKTVATIDFDNLGRKRILLGIAPIRPLGPTD